MRASLNVIASFAAGAWSAVVGLLALPVYLRCLGVEAYGLVGFLLTLQAWFLLLDMGLSTTTSREMARFSGGQHSAGGIRDLFATFEGIYLLLAALLAAAMVSASTWLASDWLQLRTLQAGDAARALSLMAAIVVPQWMSTLYRSAINGLQLQVWLGAITALFATIRALATIAALAWGAPTLEVFVCTQAASFGLEALALRLYLGRRLPPVRGRFRLETLRTVWRFAAGMTVVTVLATFLTQADKVLLARLLPLEQFGYVSLAVTVVGALAMVVIPLFNAAYPRLAELLAAGQERQLASEYHAFSQLAATVLLPLAATLVFLAPQAVYAWTGDRELTHRVAPIVAVWVVGSAINGIMHVPHALQLALGWLRPSIALNLAGAALTLPALFVLVPRHGAIAAGWVWVAVNVAYCLIGMHVTHRRILHGEAMRWYVHDVGVPGAAAVAAVMACWLAASAVEPLGRFGSAVAVAVALLAGGVAALCATPAGRRAVSGVLAAASWPATRSAAGRASD